MALAFWKRKKKTDLESVVEQAKQPLRCDDVGITYPFCANPTSDADFYWQSLENEEKAYLLEDHYVLPWDEVYQIVADPEHAHTLFLLNLPAIADLSPIIQSKGALSDADFEISLSGWSDHQGSKIRATVKRLGASITFDQQQYLLTEVSWRLLEKIREFSRLGLQKEKSDNQKCWAKIRTLALAANANMDDFLRKTIVLAPETLQLNMRRNLVATDPVVEIQPDFANAPSNWLEKFDQFNQVQDSYSINLPDGGVAHVLIDPQVKSVLNEIKRMPNRRVSGERAQTFLRNPYAQLGDEAVEVIPPASFEHSKEVAEIFSYSLLIHKKYNALEHYESAQLELNENSERESAAIALSLQNLEQTQYFIDAYQRNNSVFVWAGYDIERSTYLEQQVENLKSELEKIANYKDLQLTQQVLDLSNYSDRVIGIGEAEALHSEFIQRDSGESTWLPQHLVDYKDEFLTQDVENEFISSIHSLIQDAEEKGLISVQLPHLDQEVSLDEAKALIQDLMNSSTEQVSKPTSDDVAVKKKKTTLLIANNIDEADYTRQRIAQLYFDDTNSPQPRLPSSFRQQEFSLKKHQEYGVAWLQNLYQFAPEQVSGCLLADDMGLGKTLQLLCFIGEYLENKQNAKPILIVAPVSLLENWETEAKRFFSAKLGEILSLYGDNLKQRKIPRHLIAQQLRDEKGITHLLEHDWRGSAQIVLTTYETMRDLEFSLAREDWGIMICDEAQKIKVPTAMVTKAAKAQKADFKIACTGTPVENSLTDLWCLFDFIQENLLGPLNEFGRNYRKPIEKNEGADVAVLEQLRQLIEPQVLRRMKSDVAELPAKNDDPDPLCKKIPISKVQRSLYTDVINQYRQLSSAGNQGAMLGALHSMRMICAHPLHKQKTASIHDSPKVAWLITTLNKIKARNEKVIIFTEFRDIQIFLQRIIMEHFGLNVTTVNGDTNISSKKGMTRQSLIDRFQQVDGFNVIVLSTTAVGFGVNIQKANHVIHYTRSWNPAKEDQATDRAYRIGQEKEVFVYYPSIFAEDFDTFEIKLDQLLSDKRRLADDMLTPSIELSKELMREI